MTNVVEFSRSRPLAVDLLRAAQWRRRLWATAASDAARLDTMAEFCRTEIERSESDAHALALASAKPEGD